MSLPAKEEENNIPDYGAAYTERHGTIKQYGAFSFEF